MAQSLFAALDKLDRLGRLFENVALVVLLGAMILIATSQIVLREFFNTGLVWAAEALKLIVLWLTMFAAVAACRDDRHIRIDALSHLLPPLAIRITRVIVDLFAAGVCGVIAWQSWRYLQFEIEFEEMVLLDTPAWIAHIIVPAGFLVIAYRFVIGGMRKAFGRETEPERGSFV